MTFSALATILLALGVVPQSIDSILDRTWKEQGITPAAICDDATFLRRVTLDLVGRIPTTEEYDDFTAKPDRAAKVDQLLQDPEFARHMAETMTASWLGYARETPADRELMAQWLQDQFRNHVGFDRITKSLIAAEGQSALHGPVGFLVRHREDAGAQVCRQFLGVRLDCARCHDHPFARWTQQDLESMSLFFESVRFEEISEGNIRLTSRPRRTDEGETPRFLTGARPRTSQWRSELALFVTRSKPFARNFANRVWYHMMGRGIVDPPGDFHAENQPSVPELLEFLAATSRTQKFDLHAMVRTICLSSAYQLESRSEKPKDQRSVELFARRVIKPLTPEQLYDSYRVVLGSRPAISRREFVEQYLGETSDQDFLLTWKSRETVQTMLEQMTSDAPFHKNIASVDEAYRRVLSRAPTERDLELSRDYGLGVLVFCLVQSNEFVFNH